MVAIHYRPETFYDRWRDRWVECLQSRSIGYRVVNGYDPHIMDELRGCSAFLWHLDNEHLNDLLFAQGILQGAAGMGLLVFPDTVTGLHYSDKVAQKYLLEAIDAPRVPTWVFFNSGQALDWVKSASFPKVFKLRRGTRSLNVRLVRTKVEGVRLVRRMFGSGLHPGRGISKSASEFADAYRIQRRQGLSLGGAIAKMKKIPKYLSRHRAKARFPVERGYAYFQEFMPDNPYDTRVIVVGNRAWASNRLCRPGDFRASGSGNIVPIRRTDAGMEPIRIAFETSRRLGFQSMSYDFLTDVRTGKSLISEISCIFGIETVTVCGGVFDPDLNWHEGIVWPQDAILEDLLRALEEKEMLPAGGAAADVAQEPKAVT